MVPSKCWVLMVTSFSASSQAGLKLVRLLRSNEMARKGMSALMSAMLQHELNLLLNSREST